MAVRAEVILRELEQRIAPYQEALKHAEKRFDQKMREKRQSKKGGE
ncbi:hypothetical protein [Henriciella mobilis]|nr:hypothetical protein [Henriciella mobilis]